MNIYYRLVAYWHTRKADNLQKESNRLHHEMTEGMGYYMGRMSKLDKQVVLLRRKAKEATIPLLKVKIAKVEAEQSTGGSCASSLFATLK